MSFFSEKNNVNLDQVKSQLAQKASKDEVDTKVAQIVSGSPKGTYATLAALQTAFPTGTTGIYVVTTDGKWYYWGDSAWTAGGIYQSTGIPDSSIGSTQLALGSVDDTKIKGTIVGKNLFDKNKITAGYYVLTTNGTIAANAAYNASDYIPVLPNTNYYFNKSYHNAFYDSNKNFISGFSTAAVTSPANAAFVRLSVKPADMDTAQFELGTVATAYTPYSFTLPKLQITNDNIGIGAVGKNNLNFTIQEYETVTNKNLFDKSKATAGFYVNQTNGVLSSSTSYYASDWIQVQPNTQYSRVEYNGQFAFYDSNKNYISGGAVTYTFTTPANAYYLRSSISNANIDIEQVELGSVKTAYVPYSFSLSKLQINSNNFGVKSIGKDKLNFSAAELQIGKNKFNKDTVTTGYYVDNATGVVYANAIYSLSDWIEVVPNTQYTYNLANRIAIYDVNKTFIVGYNGQATFTTPSNAAFIRMSIRNENLNTAQLEIGSSASSYQPFGYLIDRLSVANMSVKEDLLLFLPSEICIAVGRTVELYNKQVAWAGNINNFHFKWDCSVGRSMKRKWSCTGDVAKVGSYTLTCTVYDNNMNQVATASTTVKIVNNSIANAKKILPIGDSLTNNKPWLSEVRNLSNNKISFVGTRWNGDVQGGYFNHEGRSGATAAWYVANSSYTFDSNGAGSNNPFWNPSTSQFDFNYYKTTYNINPDVVQIFLGTNGIAIDPTSNVASIKSIVDGIRVTNATMPIYIVFTLYRGDQNGIGNQLSTDGYSAGSGIWKLEEDRKVYNLMVALYGALNTYSNLYFIPVSLTHDSEYNFKSNTATAVNPRSSLTEFMDAEATHPSPRNDGYYQMADIMFSTYAAHLN
jgi:hypothetical protein